MASVSSKKRKQHLIPGGPSKARSSQVTPKVAPTQTTHSTPFSALAADIPVVDLEEETVGSPPTPATEGQVVDSHEVTPATIIPTIVIEALTPPSSIVAITPSTHVAPFTDAADSWVPSSLVPEIGESSAGPTSWLSKLSTRRDYLFGGIPLEDLKYLRKNISRFTLHQDMMHYATKVKSSSPLFFICCFCLFVLFSLFLY